MLKKNIDPLAEFTKIPVCNMTYDKSYNDINVCLIRNNNSTSNNYQIKWWKKNTFNPYVMRHQLPVARSNFFWWFVCFFSNNFACLPTSWLSQHRHVCWLFFFIVVTLQIYTFPWSLFCSFSLSKCIFFRRMCHMNALHSWILPSFFYYECHFFFSFVAKFSFEISNRIAIYNCIRRLYVVFFSLLCRLSLSLSRSHY